MKHGIWLLPVIFALAFSSCAKAPKAEMDAAEAAVARAQSSPDVVAYAPDDLRRAVQALGQMRSEAAARRFDKAKTLASEASSAAAGAIAAAGPNKERAKTKAGELIDAVKLALPKTERLLAAAAKVKKANLDRTAKAAALAGAKASLAEAESAFGKGDYLGAAAKAASAQKALADLDAEIGAAVQGATRKK